MGAGNVRVQSIFFRNGCHTSVFSGWRKNSPFPPWDNDKSQPDSKGNRRLCARHLVFWDCAEGDIIVRMERNMRLLWLQFPLCTEGCRRARTPPSPTACWSGSREWSWWSVSLVVTVGAPGAVSLARCQLRGSHRELLGRSGRHRPRLRRPSLDWH